MSTQGLMYINTSALCLDECIETLGHSKVFNISTQLCTELDPAVM
jgi:DNA-binding transcriptional regulator GbsR (MarR family)